jgi:amidohydrolase family protein
MVNNRLKSSTDQADLTPIRGEGEFAMKERFKWIAALAVLATWPLPAQAQQRIEIFDAHLHYNQEPKPFYSLDQVRGVFRRNGITGIIATSRPNKGTHELVDAKWPELKVVPFIRPYRVRSDIQTWFNDPTIFELIKEEYARGYYRGIGEFHIYGKSAQSDWVKKIVDFAVERDLYLHAHCDEEALLILFRHNPKARIIWAHTGFSVAPARVAELLDEHKDALWGELSYRGGITGGDGKLTSDWRNLFASYSDRFLLGSDTWINERWFGYDTIFKEYRGWLAQIPADQAQRIASGNALRLFGLRRE